MTKEEYVKKMSAQKDWAPGWDAIEAEFSRLYPKQDPMHYGTSLTSRAQFGGKEYLDGYSVYRSPRGYFHIVTFGMSELYCDPGSFGNEFSGWGYEMTMKLKAESPEDCLWAINMMGGLARYTNKSGDYFEAGEFFAGNGKPLHAGTGSKITGLVIASDTSAKAQDTVHGKVEFLQLVGITAKEAAALKAGTIDAGELLALMERNDPELVTDMQRETSYI